MSSPLSGNQASVDVNIRVTSPDGIIFEKKIVRKAMGIVGREVQKEARGLVAHGGGSHPGEYPGTVSGFLSRSIAYKVSKPGFLVVVRPQRPSAFGGKEFYPYFLHYGVHTASRKKSHKKHAADTAFRVAPRRNYMSDALENKSARVRAVITAAVKDALGA